MKLSPCILPLAMMMVAQPQVSAFTISSADSRLQAVSSSSSSPSRLYTSMSTMNLLEEEEEEISSTVNADKSSRGPLAASTVTIQPVTSNAVDWDWEQVAASVFAGEDQRPIVLFDGVCNLCNGGVNFAMDHDPEARLRFCSLQSKVAQSLLLQAGQKPWTNKIVLVTKDQTYLSGEAVARICQHLDGLPPLQWMGHVGEYAPEWIREPILQFVAKHRYHFGENDSCRLDFDGTMMSRFVSDPVEIADV